MPDKKSYTATHEEGVVYVPNETAFRYQDITIDKIRKIRKNAYGAALYDKRKSLLFQARPVIEVLDPNNDTDEELQTKISRMFSAKDVNLPWAIERSYHDRFWYGCYVFNDVWEVVDGTYTLTKLRHLPAHTFSDLPTGRLLYNIILQGITLDPEGNAEFYQMDGINSQPQRLDPDNLFWGQDPGDEELGGSPVVLPVVPFIEMINYSWNGAMQLLNRLAIPPLFIKIISPQPASPQNGMVSDVEYAKRVLAHWGKDNAYPLRENMEVVVPNITDTGVTTEIIEALHFVLIDYSSPASFITKSGSILNGASTSQQELMEQYIQGILRWLEESFSRLAQKYLDANHYEGYTARVVIPHVPVKDKTVRLNQARFGAQSGVLTINECRARIDAEGLDADAIQGMGDEWGAFREASGIGVPSFPDAFQATNLDADDLPTRPSEVNATRVARKTEQSLADAYTVLEKEVMALLPRDGETA